MENLQEQYDLIESSVFYIRRLSNGIQKETEQIRRTGNMNANALLEIMQGLKDLLNAIFLTSEVTDISREESSEQIKECIKEVAQAYSNEDVIYVTDLLEYEIIPMLNDWRKILVSAYKQKPEQ